jgi:hypothetical protein
MASAPIDPRRRGLPFGNWPELDRQLWEDGCRPGHGLDDPGYGALLGPKSREKAQDGYGRWLGFLAWLGGLDPAAHPVERVTRDRAAKFFALMRELGNRDYTITSRFQELRMALRIMAPDRDVSWLVRPGGISLHSRLPMQKRAFQVPHAAVLYRWGFELMQEALTLAGADRRRVRYRDGLLIAMFASRARRLRAMSGLRVGQEIVRNGDGYRLVLPPELVKTRRPDEVDLPSSLTPAIERYLAVERVELLQGCQHDWFWVNWNGEPLGYRGIDKRIRWLSEKRFGTAFGPHRFRYALVTSSLLDDPAHPGLAAGLLGITGEMVEEHYDRADQVSAVNRFNANLAAERARTEGLAERAFKERSPRCTL